MELTPLQARVLGVLIEKEHTVPDSYPLSLAALTSGCNQKNNRDPVLKASETDVQEAVDALRSRLLVIESSGQRVMRYSHNAGRVLRVPDQSVAVLATLMLRGPQTAGELRINSERLHAFADTSSVEAFLDELARRAVEAGGPLVVRLARRPGEREARWAHLLSGPPTAAVVDKDEPGAASADLAALREQVERLAADVADLRAAVARMADRNDRSG